MAENIGRGKTGNGANEVAFAHAYYAVTEIVDFALADSNAPPTVARELEDKLGRPWKPTLPSIHTVYEPAGIAVDIFSLDQYLHQLMRAELSSTRFGLKSANILVGFRNNKLTSGKALPFFQAYPDITTAAQEKLGEREPREVLLEKVKLGGTEHELVTAWSFRRSLAHFAIARSSETAPTMHAFQSAVSQVGALAIPASFEAGFVDKGIAYLGASLESSVGLVRSLWGIEPRAIIDVVQDPARAPKTSGRGVPNMRKYVELLERAEGTD